MSIWPETALLMMKFAGNCIIDDEVCRAASEQEIIRRYFKCLKDLKQQGHTTDDKYKLELLMKQAGISVDKRKVVKAALNREEATGEPAMAIELHNGTIVTGRTSDLLGASSAALMNAIKVLAGIDHEIKLISPEAIEPITKLKTKYLGSRNPRLHSDEILIALSTTAAKNEMAASALSFISELKGCEAHSSVILSSVDEQIFRKLGINLTCEPKYEEDDRRYHKK